MALTASAATGAGCRVIAVVEKELGGRFHIHAAIEPPRHMSRESFERMVEQCWLKTDYGYGRIHFAHKSDGGEPDSGWIAYMLKAKQKSGLEDWSDCIDWDSFHNPITGA